MGVRLYPGSVADPHRFLRLSSSRLRSLPAGALDDIGQGEAGKYESNGQDSFEGTADLRLHVSHSDGAVFILSDPITVWPEFDYLDAGELRPKPQILSAFVRVRDSSLPIPGTPVS